MISFLKDVISNVMSKCVEGFNRNQFEDLIIRSLKEFDEAVTERKLYSETAVNLLLGTAAQESSFGYYLKQIRGPALGAFQMEPATFSWLKGVYGSYEIHDFEEQEYNLKQAILLCRLRYYVVPNPLPKNDKYHLAEYWKDWYNTYRGAGTVKEFVYNYEKFIEGKTC